MTTKKTINEIIDEAYDLFSDGQCHDACELLQFAFSVAQSTKEREDIQAALDEFMKHV
jgi:hypothetical protein